VCFSFFAALFILISIAVYAGKSNDLFASSSSDYGFAFVVCILGMIITIAAGIVFLVELLKNKSDDKQ
jgi:TRAP-type C4-dicarboxylate transport system permease small subunit